MPYQYRKSPRAFWYEYNEGLYFVTVCTRDKRHYFGRISSGIIHHTEIGRFLVDELRFPHLHHPEIDIRSFVVMPNHFHALVEVKPTSDNVNLSDRHVKQISQKRLPPLSRYIGSLKSAVSRYANLNGISFAWQERFHDHIIRGIEEEYRIMDYIENNVQSWEHDCFNPNLLCRDAACRVCQDESE